MIITIELEDLIRASNEAGRVIVKGVCGFNDKTPISEGVTLQDLVDEAGRTVRGEILEWSTIKRPKPASA